MPATYGPISNATLKRSFMLHVRLCKFLGPLTITNMAVHQRSHVVCVAPYAAHGPLRLTSQTHAHNLKSKLKPRITLRVKRAIPKTTTHLALSGSSEGI